MLKNVESDLRLRDDVLIKGKDYKESEQGQFRNNWQHIDCDLK